jgi:hypothetical protein
MQSVAGLSIQQVKKKPWSKTKSLELKMKNANDFTLVPAQA